MEGKSVAITPNHGIALTVIKPKNGIWGHFIIPLTPEQTEKLKKYRINPHFSFVPAYITIDKIERRSTGKVNEYEHFISVEVDQRQWAGLKKGSTLIIELPDGTILKENLRGSMTVMKKVERRL
ncbi:hypothetical protein A9Q99_27080 [Gammaproteobacteria bacterium 45_16_T64]|nr:hypothetical protein A9Q99_27080 [Gammaproteobacteria bacterium 45_16_T64]